MAAGSSRGELASAPAESGAVGQPDTPLARSYRFVGITVLALLGLLAMAGIKSYRDLAAAKAVENDLRREITATAARVEALDKTIDRIKNDPAMLERIAREELGMVREGDVVIVLPGGDEATPRAAAATGLAPALGESRQN